jgi:hypothetical protein
MQLGILELVAGFTLVSLSVCPLHLQYDVHLHLCPGTYYRGTNKDEMNGQLVRAAYSKLTDSGSTVRLPKSSA